MVASCASAVLLTVMIVSARHGIDSDKAERVGQVPWVADLSGERLAFTASVKTGDDEVPQVFVMPMSGGDARQITTAPMGVQQYAWRPEGRDIAYVTEDGPADKDAHKKGHDAFEVSSNDYLVSDAAIKPAGECR